MRFLWVCDVASPLMPMSKVREIIPGLCAVIGSYLVKLLAPTNIIFSFFFSVLGSRMISSSLRLSEVNLWNLQNSEVEKVQWSPVILVLMESYDTGFAIILECSEVEQV